MSTSSVVLAKPREIAEAYHLSMRKNIINQANKKGLLLPRINGQLNALMPVEVICSQLACERCNFQPCEGDDLIFSLSGRSLTVVHRNCYRGAVPDVRNPEMVEAWLMMLFPNMFSAEEILTRLFRSASAKKQDEPRGNKKSKRDRDARSPRVHARH